MLEINHKCETCSTIYMSHRWEQRLFCSPECRALKLREEHRERQRARYHRIRRESLRRMGQTPIQAGRRNCA